MDVAECGEAGRLAILHFKELEDLLLQTTFLPSTVASATFSRRPTVPNRLEKTM